ncbi:glycosyltransferase [Paenibacillus qinlingensis]|uniref:glycosyltransferase n=1 Tax=Paenibacillus qinlingensis TaxID=1837343 RepID=UPI0015643D21|nr:glycosyltransferase [Paenibacillus qinlingensis]NQX59451.1 glycosyltransferase [Paenibacillus qinlingensis]
MKKTVLYIGNFSFPLGNAAGKRVYANGKLLKDIGYDVVFVGMSKEFISLKPLEETKKKFDEFAYYDFPYPNKIFDWLNYGKLFSELTRFLANEKILDEIGLVIYYGSPSLSLFITKLIKFFRKQNIKVIADCVDWLTTKTNNPLFDIVKWADNTYQKAYVNKKANGIIAISSYLSDYYGKNDCMTVIIPPLSPVEYCILDQKSINNNVTILSYAGLPFRKGQLVKDLSKLKDRIDKTVILLHQAKIEGCEFIFNVYGFTKSEYLIAIPNHKKYIDELADNIVFHGHKSNEEVVKNIIKSDFTILIRDVNRDTTAGFPTKISESISCGTPVITTRTSDLGEYIIEGENGFFINNTDEMEYAVSDIKKILCMNQVEIKVMEKKCLDSKIFYYKNYVNKLAEFISKVLEERVS